MDLGYNAISGTIPPQIGEVNHQALRVLGLGPNLLTHVNSSICPVLVNASTEHLRCGLAKNPLVCPVPSCVLSAPLRCGAVCHNASLPTVSQPYDTQTVYERPMVTAYFTSKAVFAACFHQKQVQIWVILAEKSVQFNVELPAGGCPSDGARPHPHLPHHCPPRPP